MRKLTIILTLLLISNIAKPQAGGIAFWSTAIIASCPEIFVNFSESAHAPVATLPSGEVLMGGGSAAYFSFNILDPHLILPLGVAFPNGAPSGENYFHMPKQYPERSITKFYTSPLTGILVKEWNLDDPCNPLRTIEYSTSSGYRWNTMATNSSGVPYAIGVTLPAANATSISIRTRNLNTQSGSQYTQVATINLPATYRIKSSSAQWVSEPVVIGNNVYITISAYGGTGLFKSYWRVGVFRFTLGSTTLTTIQDWTFHELDEVREVIVYGSGSSITTSGTSRYFHWLGMTDNTGGSQVYLYNISTNIWGAPSAATTSFILYPSAAQYPARFIQTSATIGATTHYVYYRNDSNVLKIFQYNTSTGAWTTIK